MKFRILVYVNLAFLICSVIYQWTRTGEFESREKIRHDADHCDVSISDVSLENCQFGLDETAFALAGDWVTIGNGLAVRKGWKIECFHIDQENKLIYGEPCAKLSVKDEILKAIREMKK